MLTAHRPYGLKLPRRLAVLVAATLLLTSCKVDVQLGIRAAEDGSGAVRARFVLDGDALDAIGGDLEEQLRVADLLQSGWKVDVSERKGGGAEAVAEKRFAGPEEFSAAIDELSGDIGPFQDFGLRRERSTFSTSFRFEGKVDLESGVGASSLNPQDPGITEEIEAQGVDVEQLREFLRERVDQAFDFEIVVDLPGSGSNNAPDEVGGAPRWTPRVGEVVVLRAESSATDADRIALVVLGTVLLLVAAGIGVAWWIRRRRGAGAETVSPPP